MESLLAKAKGVCRVTSNAFDEEIKDLIEAGLQDLEITTDSEIGAIIDKEPLVVRALMTYVKMFFRSEEYEKLKPSYDEQKAQLSMAKWSGRYE